MEREFERERESEKETERATRRYMIDSKKLHNVHGMRGGLVVYRYWTT